MAPYRKTARVDIDQRRREEEEAQDEAIVMRDYVMARGAAALAALHSAQEDVLQAMALFITPSDDRKGRERKEALDAAIESASIATRALEDAMDKLDEADLEAVEPWEEIDEDEESAS